MKYNERIREIREDNHLTQQKIANLLHLGKEHMPIMKAEKQEFLLIV